MIDIIRNYWDAILYGLYITFQICLASWVLGIFLGILLGILRFKKHVFNSFFQFLSLIIGGIPVLVFLFWIHYPLQTILNVVIPPFYTLIFTLTIVNTVTVSEIIEKSLDNLPKQFLIVGQMLGMSNKSIIYKIQLPLIFRSSIGSILTMQINILHFSIFGSLISVEEIFRILQRINSQIYKPIELYSLLAIFFILITVPLIVFSNFLKKRYSRDYSQI